MPKFTKCGITCTATICAYAERASITRTIEAQLSQRCYATLRVVDNVAVTQDQSNLHH